MARTGLVLAFALLAACGGSKSSTQPEAPPSNQLAAKEETPPPAPAAPATGVQAVMAKFESFSSRMCECKDSACAEKVSGELTTWAQEMSKDPAANELKPNEAETKRMGELATKLGDCMASAMGAGGTGAGSATP